MRKQIKISISFSPHIFLLSIDKKILLQELYLPLVWFFFFFINSSVMGFVGFWLHGILQCFSRESTLQCNQLQAIPLKAEAHGPALNTSIRHPLFLPLPGQKAHSLNNKVTFQEALEFRTVALEACSMGNSWNLWFLCLRALGKIWQNYVFMYLQSRSNNLYSPLLDKDKYWP